MALKKLGKYGDIVGGMPLGMNEPNWWTKIGQDYMQDIPDSQPTNTVKVGDMFGSMPAGFNPNDIPSYLEQVGQPFNPSTGEIGTPTIPETPGTPTIPPTTEPSKPFSPIIAPTSVNTAMDRTMGAYAGMDDNAYINAKLAEWNNNPANMPTTAEGMAAKLGLTYTPPTATATPGGADVKYEMTPFGGRTAYQSSYDPALEAQQNKLALENARLGALPGLQEALAGAGERANLAAGEGGKSGMAYEFQRKPLEKFASTLAQTAGQLESASLQTKKEDKIAKAKWDMEQDVKEHDWLRGETSKLFGAQYAQDLNDKEWERNNAAQVAKDNIELAYRNGEISREEAWKRWSVTNDERLRSLNEQRADLEWQRQVAQQNNMFDKQAALQREMKAIDQEIARQNQESADEAAMWGGIASLAGDIITAPMTGGTSLLGKVFGW